MAIQTNSRASKLQALQSAMPVASQRAARGIQQAQAVQLQQAAAAAPAAPQAGGYQAAQQQGAALTQAVGQAGVEAAGQQLANQSQVGELGLSEEARGQRARLANQEMAARQDEADTGLRLAALGESNKKQIWDSRLDFSRNQANQKYLNERQMADLALTKAKDVEQFKDYQQQVQQGVEKRLKMMDIAFKKISQALEQEYQWASQKGKQAHKRYLYDLKKKIEDQIRKEREDAADSRNMWTQAGTVGGAVVGGILGGPQGAIVGAELGSQAGEIGYSQFG